MFVALTLVTGLSRGDETIGMAPGEQWWGAANYFGTNMPFTAGADLLIDLRKENYNNQCAAFLISDRGRVL